MIEKEKVDFVCIQETKLDLIDRRLVEKIWRHGEVDWVYSGSIGNSGGLLCAWDKDSFEIVEMWGESWVFVAFGRERRSILLMFMHLVRIHKRKSFGGG